MNKYILSTIAWVESIAKREILKQWWTIFKVKDRIIEFEWTDDVMIRVNLWSRVWNKVYKILTESENIDDFDKLYNLINNINLKNYFKKKFPLSIKVKSINSSLFSVPTIQKITTKAIINNLTNNSGERVKFDSNLEKFEIMILLINNKARILLNTSWDSLHKRGYRIETWDAPIKENLAAALVLLSWWKFNERFYDLFCGSWTIVIEAAMIAKNIAPGLKRKFAFNELWIINRDIYDKELIIAENKIFNGTYDIFASDIDSNILDIAKSNAKNAGVLDNIKFMNIDFTIYIKKKLKWTLVSNPPYWYRLNVDDLDYLYKNINKLLKENKNLKWWIITSYFLWFNKIIKLSNFKRRKLYNWWEKTYFYKKIN